MRFFSLLTNVIAASFVTGALAAPSSLDAESNAVLKRSLGAGQVLTIVNNVRQTANTVQTNINQALAGVSSSSPLAVRKAAAQKVIAQFGTLTTAISTGVADVTRQANGQQVKLMVRQSPGHNETQDLIQALAALVTLVDNTIIQVVTTLGLTELVPPIMAALAVFSQFFLTISAVVVDFLPFLGPIGQFLQGIGSILQGVGSIVH